LDEPVTPKSYAKARALFFLLCDLPPGNKEDLLCRFCDDDQDVRNEIEALLVSDELEDGPIPREPGPRTSD
jgi:hypothetical protein